MVARGEWGRSGEFLPQEVRGDGGELKTDVDE